MEEHKKNIILKIESIYPSFTNTEKIIADFFIHNTEFTDFSAKAVSSMLYVSEPALSRFAKKCGFAGYRNFRYAYEEAFSDPAETVVTGNSTNQVIMTYQELLTKCCSLVDEKQMERLCKLFLGKKHIYVYGKGSSGLAAMEMKLRFMRIGISIECITDDHMMQMDTALLDDSCLVIGISISGTTCEIINSLKDAKKQGCVTVLFSARKSKDFEAFIDEPVLVAVREHLSNGPAISPQFPLLIITDIFYSHFLKYDTCRKKLLRDSARNALHERNASE